MDFSVFNITKSDDQQFFAGSDESQFCKDFNIFDFDEDFDDVYLLNQSVNLNYFLTHEFIYRNVGSLIAKSTPDTLSTIGIVVLFSQSYEGRVKSVHNKKYSTDVDFLGNFSVDNIS